MLYARRLHSRSYAVTGDDGGLVTVWNPLNWQRGGQFVLYGGVGTVRWVGWGSQRVQLFDPYGAEAALAAPVTSTRWSVVTHHGTFRFRRLGYEQRLMADDDVQVGYVRRVRDWQRPGADAHLPGMPTQVAVFTVAVALQVWVALDAAASQARAGLHQQIARLH
jgi:hypothetical protein